LTFFELKISISVTPVTVNVHTNLGLSVSVHCCIKSLYKTQPDGDTYEQDP